jgi:hypothetical protein
MSRAGASAVENERLRVKYGESTPYGTADERE